MKKTYFAPEMLMVALSTRASILQASLQLYDGEEVTDSNEILTKGVVTNKTIWDNEW